MNKTKWYARPIYLLVALAVVLSLGVGGIVNENPLQPPQVSASTANGSLIVDIVKVINATGVQKTTFDVGEYFLVNAAVAYKNINDINGTENVSVSATIDPGQYAELASGEVAPKDLGVIPSNNVTDVWWRLHCTGEGSTIITVTATNSSSGLSDADSVTVTQGTPLPPVLVVTLIECPSGKTLNQSDDFVIKANVTNINGTIVARDVWGIISGYQAVNASVKAPNKDRWFLGDIWPGETEEVMWNLHCDGPGKGYVTIDAEASNLVASQIEEDECYVDQGLPGPVTVTVDVIPKICASPCCYPRNLFTVTATFCNSYGETATNVTATLNITGLAYLNGSEVATHNLTNSTGGRWILNGTCSNTTSWNVSCEAVGTATFTVTTAANQTWATASGTDSISQQDSTLKIMDVTNPHGQNLTYPTLTGNTTTVETCQNFTVNTTFQNCMDAMLTDANFTIALPSSVELRHSSTVHIVQTNLSGSEIANFYVDPANTSVILHTLCACCRVNITWELHCKATSLGVAENITVTAYNNIGVKLDSDYFKVIQIEKAHLTAGTEVYPGNYTDNTLVTTAVNGLPVCQYFTLVIPVFNLGEAAATGVSVNYTINGSATCNGTYTSSTISTLSGGRAEKILIPCHCNGETDLNITINFINGTDSITTAEIIDANKYYPVVKHVMQIPFTVTIVQPSPGATFNCSDEFAVKVNITNNSTDLTNNVTGVNATISWTGPGCAEFVNATNQSYTISLGAINYHSNPQEAAWLMHCCGVGNVTFTVTVTAENPLMNIVRTVTVTQRATTTLNVTILSPEYVEADGAKPPTYAPINGNPQDLRQYATPTYATCEQFAVTATVTNIGTRPAANVTATIDPGDYCDVVGTSIIPIGALGPGASQIVSWTLHAASAEAACEMVPNSITVTATAICTVTGSDDVDVDIYPAAHLVVTATAPTAVEVGSDFKVNATVTNTGWADASQVVLSIDTGANSALAAGESLTKTIGTLVGFGNSSSVAVNWTLQCARAPSS